MREKFHLTQTLLEENFLLQNSVCMSLMQIGELTKKFSEQFLEDHQEIPWHEIRATRNVFAHQYSDTNMQWVWGTIETDIPVLTRYCIDLLKKNHAEVPEREVI